MIYTILMMYCFLPLHIDPTIEQLPAYDADTTSNVTDGGSWEVSMDV